MELALRQKYGIVRAKKTRQLIPREGVECSQKMSRPSRWVCMKFRIVMVGVEEKKIPCAKTWRLFMGWQVMGRNESKLYELCWLFFLRREKRWSSKGWRQPRWRWTEFKVQGCDGEERNPGKYRISSFRRNPPELRSPTALKDLVDQNKSEHIVRRIPQDKGVQKSCVF